MSILSHLEKLNIARLFNFLEEGERVQAEKAYRLAEILYLSIPSNRYDYIVTTLKRMYVDDIVLNAITKVIRQYRMSIREDHLTVLIYKLKTLNLQPETIKSSLRKAGVSRKKIQEVLQAA